MISYICGMAGADAFDWSIAWAETAAGVPALHLMCPTLYTSTMFAQSLHELARRLLIGLAETDSTRLCTRAMDCMTLLILFRAAL